MERNQVETNKRLDDVMKSNMNLQNMLQTMLSSLSCTDVARDKNLIRTGTPILGETSGNGTDVDFHKEGESGGLGSNEQWWDVLCRTSDDKAYGDRAASSGRSPTRTWSTRYTVMRDCNVHISVSACIDCVLCSIICTWCAFREAVCRYSHLSSFTFHVQCYVIE